MITQELLEVKDNFREILSLFLPERKSPEGLWCQRSILSYCNTIKIT